MSLRYGTMTGEGPCQRGGGDRWGAVGERGHQAAEPGRRGRGRWCRARLGERRTCKEAAASTWAAAVLEAGAVWPRDKTEPSPCIRGTGHVLFSSQRSSCLRVARNQEEPHFPGSLTPRERDTHWTQAACPLGAVVLPGDSELGHKAREQAPR